MAVTDLSPGTPTPTVLVADTDPLIGLELGGFKVVKLLAAGGMGLVYEALHQTIGRRAAVKVLKPDIAADAEWTKRFLSEARALGSLKHRNLIEVLNFGKTPDGREFLMMEFLDGEPLDAYIHRLGQLAPAVALGIVEQILNGLAEAHKKGVVHRDLKPGNVFLLREHNGELLVKVLDFGLARQEPVALLDATVPIPRGPEVTSLLAGTPEYIAPEQAQGKKVDGSADLYSLGVMLFEMLTGRLPFEADSVIALLQKHLSERPPRLSAVMNNVPEGLEEFVEALLAKEPERRPSSADAARMTVQRLLKRLAQDSTAVRTVAGVDPKLAPTLKIDRHLQATTTDKAVQAAGPEGKKARGWLLALLVVVPLMGLGVLLAARGGEREVVVPPMVKVAPVATTAPAVPETGPELEELAPLLPTNEAPKLNPPTTAKAGVPVECTPEWREKVQADIKEMSDSDLVLKSDEATLLYAEDGKRVDSLVKAAKSSKECARAQASYAELRRKLGFPAE